MEDVVGRIMNLPVTDVDNFPVPAAMVKVAAARIVQDAIAEEVAADKDLQSFRLSTGEVVTESQIKAWQSIAVGFSRDELRHLRPGDLGAKVENVPVDLSWGDEDTAHPLHDELDSDDKYKCTHGFLSCRVCWKGSE